MRREEHLEERRRARGAPDLAGREAHDALHVVARLRHVARRRRVLRRRALAGRHGLLFLVGAELVIGHVVGAEGDNGFTDDAAPEARTVDDLDRSAVAGRRVVKEVAANAFVARDADERAARVHVQAERSLAVDVDGCSIIVSVVAFERRRRQRRGRAMLVQLERGCRWQDRWRHCGALVSPHAVTAPR